MSSSAEPGAHMLEKHDGAAHGPLDVRVWLRLLSCSMTIEKMLRRKFAEQFETTLPRFDVMASLDRHPQGQTMGQLSRALLVSNGNVTSIVRQLEEQGYVDTRSDPEDRRSSIVVLSAAGKAQFDRLAAAHHRWIAEAFEGVEPESLAGLHGLLAELKASIAGEGRQ
jgi:DNA-binding MarR family transcriptional regulator